MIVNTLTATHVTIHTAADLAVARRCVRVVGVEQGVESALIEALATAVTEVCRNVLQHAGHGDLVIEPLDEQGRRGVKVTLSDRGPGIADLERAMQDGYSTTGGLGCGLPGARRLVHDFDIITTHRGTVVTLTQWGKHR